MAFCQNCGNALASGVAFCTSCGGQQPASYPVQPAYPPAPYGAPYPPQPYYAYQRRGTNGLAIASLVLGVLWIYWLGSVLALIFGYIARGQIRRTPQDGNGLAIAGIVLGWIGVVVLVVVILVAVGFSQSSTG